MQESIKLKFQTHLETITKAIQRFSHRNGRTMNSTYDLNLIVPSGNTQREQEIPIKSQ